MANLTDVQLREWVKAAKPIAGKSDGGGLTIMLSRSGPAAWVLRYHVAGRHRELSLRRYPDVSLKEARRRGSEERARIAAGVDVAADKRRQRIAHARSRTSGENLFDLFMAPFSQRLEPPQNPGRFITTPVQSQDLDHLDDLRYCPATFQEQVSKHLELRTTVVGDWVFTAAIVSQRSERSRFDWHRDGLGLIDDWEPYRLPVEVEESLLKLRRFFGLNYGAADFILPPDGRHVFLEVNSVGEFFWLERNPGFPISATLADLLVSGSRAR